MKDILLSVILVIVAVLTVASIILFVKVVAVTFLEAIFSAIILGI